MKFIVVPLAFFGVMSASAYPVVSDVVLAQPRRTIKVTYTLSNAPGVVTVDFQTNVSAGVWASIGAENFTTVRGDVNRLVATGSRTITWKPRAEWPGMKISAGNFRAVVTVRDVTQPPDWMTADLATGAVRYYAISNAVPGGISDDRYKTTHLLLRKIPAAMDTFIMGSAVYENRAFGGSPVNYPEEIPHPVTLTSDYYMSIYETTQAQYTNVTHSSNPTTATNLVAGCKAPVSNVSYSGLRGSVWPGDNGEVSGSSFFGILRDCTGARFDLPTEAQWEYACRAGTTQAFNDGSIITNTQYNVSLERLAWTEINSDGYVHEVGLKLPNAWYLHDMHGNVGEFCLDWYGEYPAEATDPKGPDTGSGRVTRGGGYMHYEQNLRSARRTSTSGSAANLGFRICAPAVAYAGKGDE